VRRKGANSLSSGTAMANLPSKDPNQSPKMGLRQSTICNRCGAQIPIAEAHWRKSKVQAAAMS